MNPRTTGILFLIAAALGAFVYFYEIRGGQERDEADALAKRLFPDLEADEVDRFVLTTLDGLETTVDRVDEGWRITQPVDFAADKLVMGNMTTALTLLSREGTVQSPQPPDVYGLGDAAEVVRFWHDGDEEMLRLGIETPVGANSYAAAGEEGGVSIVSTFRLNAFRKELRHLRDSRIVHFDRTAVTGLQLGWPGGGVGLELRDGEWWLVTPVDDSADEKAVGDLLSDLSFLRAEGFVDEPTPEDLAGFEEPTLSLELRIEPEGGRASTQRFELGGVDAENFRLARGTESALYRVGDDRFSDLPRSLLAYRNKRLSYFALDEPKRIEVVFAPENEAEVTYELVLEDDVWYSGEAALPKEKSDQLLGMLARLEATEVAAESVGPDELSGLGLAPPRATFRVLGIDAEAPPIAEVHLGVSDPAKGTIALRPDRPAIYRLHPSTVARLPLTAAEFEKALAAEEAEEAEELVPGELVPEE